MNWREQAAGCSRIAFGAEGRGRDEPVYHGAKLIGYKRKFSDSALRMFLMAKKPESWSEQHRTEIGATVSIRTEIIELPPLDPVLDARTAWVGK